MAQFIITLDKTCELF